MSKNKKIKQINFSVLYGVIEKKKKDTLWINYGAGKIKVFLDDIDQTEELNIGYTISVSGYLQQGWIRTYLMAQQVSIFDKRPHYIKLED